MLEHAGFIGDGCWLRLPHVPALRDLSVLKTEDMHNGQCQ